MCVRKRARGGTNNKSIFGFRLFFLGHERTRVFGFIFILTLLVPFLSKLKSPQMNEGESRAPAAPQP